MPKPMVSLSFHRPCFSRLVRSVRLPTRQAENGLVPWNPPSGQRQHQSLARFGPSHLRFLSSSTRQCFDGSSNTPPRSPRRDQDQPSWLHTSPDSDVPLQGTVTEIQVPGAGTFPFSNLWLSQNIFIHTIDACRDNCPCEKCTHPQTRQRQHNSFEIPLNIGIESLSKDGNGVRVRWNNNSHESVYSWEWLRSWKGSFRTSAEDFDESLRHWRHVDPSRPDLFPTVHFEQIMKSDIGVADWTKRIYEHGFSFVIGCPVTPSATQSLLERIAFIQHTHYGGFWDFTSSSTPTDTAYTNQPLGVHTDTTYLSTPCGLQMFHLLSHTDGAGGESLFVDGYAAAAHLRDTKPASYLTLSRQKILRHASGNNEVGEINNSGMNSRGSPTMAGGLAHDTESFEAPRSRAGRALIKPRGTPLMIRWNNDDRDAQTWRSLNSIERWYKAAREWTRILSMKEFEIKIQLKPGQPIIFDNWRYLHGRTGFSGKRRICGGYISMDDFLARYRMTNFGPRNGLNPSYFYEQRRQEQQAGLRAPYINA